MIKPIKNYLHILGINGLLCTAKALLTNKEVFCKLHKFHCKHPFKVRTPSSDLRTTKQVFINLEYDFVVETEPTVIVDAGANIGLAAIYFANKYQNAKIIAIEPELNNFNLLKQNVEPYPNILPIHAALWDNNEEINLVDPGFGHWRFITSSNLTADTPPDNTCHKVMAMTINKIITDYNLEKIDILKIDIEGAEKEVFHSSSSWIEKVNAIIIELHEDLKTGCNRSFYCGSNGFDNEWHQGENVYLSRDNYITKKSS